MEGLWQNRQMIMRTVLKEVFLFYHHSIMLMVIGFIAIRPLFVKFTNENRSNYLSVFRLKKTSVIYQIKSIFALLHNTGFSYRYLK